MIKSFSFKFTFYNQTRLIVLILLIIATVSCTSATAPVMETEAVEDTPKPDPTATLTKTPEMTPTPTMAPIVINQEDLAGITIRFAHPWAGDGAKVFEDIAFEFSMSNPWDIWVDVEAVGSESVLLEGLQSDLDSGDVPGLIAAHPFHLSAHEDDTFSVDLTEYYNDPQWGFTADKQKDIPDLFIEQFRVGEKLTALPVAPQATVLFYNRTWAEELGFSTAPEDEQAFRNQACDATFANYDDINQDNDGTGGWLINFDPQVLASWHVAFGGQLPESGTPEFNTNSGLDAFGYLKSVYDQGCFWIGRQSQPYFYFANRYTLMYAGTLEQIPAQKGWMALSEYEDEWIAIGFPGSEGEVMFVDGPGLMIPKDSPENQMAAWLFARHLLEPEVQARIVHSLYTLPVRTSAVDSLTEFEADTPQWANAVAMIEIAQALPVTEGWGAARWVLQDAVIMLMQSAEDETAAILEQLDATVRELEGLSP